MKSGPFLIAWLKHALCAAVFLFAASLFFACRTASEPERTLNAYINAVLEGRCQEARGLLSTRTNHALDFLREKPQHPQNPLPVEEYFCGQFAFEDCKPQKMTLTRQDGEMATISMPCGRTQDGILPGFSSPFLKYEPRGMQLVRENGEWRVVEPTPIRIVEIREKEERMIEDALRRNEELRRYAAKRADKQKL